MSISTFAPLAAAWVSITATLLLTSRNWRVSISALGALYMGVFLLVSISWPVEYAIIKLITGWIAAAVLGIGLVEQQEAWEDELGRWISGTLFRIFLAGFVIFVVIVLAPSVTRLVIRANTQQVTGGLALIGLGLLQLGLTAQPTRVIFGLITILAGFEIFYATMETSLLVNAMLAAITLGLALMGAYFTAVPDMETEI